MKKFEAYTDASFEFMQDVPNAHEIVVKKTINKIIDDLGYDILSDGFGVNIMDPREHKPTRDYERNLCDELLSRRCVRVTVYSKIVG